jgi:hypothetical protein
MVLGAGLAAVGRVRTGQISAVLGAHAAAVDHDASGLCRGLWTGADHAQQHTVNTRQHRLRRPV